MLRDEIALFTKLSGRDGEHAPIGVIGAYLDGYEKGCEDAKAKYERPQGEWIHYLGCGVGKAVCSECGQLGETKKYCGNCGADMRGDKE